MGVLIQGNVVEGVRGPPAIFVRPDRWNRPSDARIIANKLINISVRDQDIAAIQAVGERITVEGNRVSGSYPHLVWAGGDEDQLVGNSGDPARTKVPYETHGAQHLRITRP